MNPTLDRPVAVAWIAPRARLPSARFAIEAAIPRGGVVVLQVRNESDGLSIGAIARGPKARLSDFTESALSGDTPEEGWSARTIQPLYANLVANDLSGAITATAAEEQVTFLASGLRAEG